MKEKTKLKSRPVDINLNTAGQSLELRIALFLCPLTLTLPVLLLIILSKVSVILAATDLFFIILAVWAPWKVLHLANNRLRFEPEILRLGLGPGIPFEMVQALDITCDSAKRPLSLRLTLSDNRPLKINLSGISKEDAAQLWTLISNKLRNAAITPAVRETLRTWHSSLVESLPSSSEEKLQDNQDLRLLINLQTRRRTSAANDSEFRFWVAWIGSATTMTMLIYWLVAVATNRLNLPDFIWGEPGYHLFKSLVIVIVLLFGNIFGALAFVGTLVYLLYQSFRRWTAADSVFIDSLGFTAQIRTPAGTLP